RSALAGSMCTPGRLAGAISAADDAAVTGNKFALGSGTGATTMSGLSGLLPVEFTTEWLGPVGPASEKLPGITCGFVASRATLASLSGSTLSAASLAGAGRFAETYSFACGR